MKIKLLNNGGYPVSDSLVFPVIIDDCRAVRKSDFFVSVSGEELSSIGFKNCKDIPFLEFCLKAHTLPEEAVIL